MAGDQHPHGTDSHHGGGPHLTRHPIPDPADVEKVTVVQGQNPGFDGQRRSPLRVQTMAEANLEARPHAGDAVMLRRLEDDHGKLTGVGVLPLSHFRLLLDRLEASGPQA
jgi:hypothetical protein